MDTTTITPPRLIRTSDGEMAPSAEKAIVRLQGAIASKKITEIIAFACKYGLAISVRIRLDAQGRMRTNITLEE